MINPTQKRFPEEHNLIGRMVLAYTEFDISLCFSAGYALGEKWSVLKALHTIENESTRLEVVNELIAHKVAAKGLQGRFGEAIGAMRHCKKIRNQYAHAQWMTHGERFGFFSTKDVRWSAGQQLPMKVVDIQLLQEQSAYFEYTRNCLIWFENEFEFPGNNIMIWPARLPMPPLVRNTEKNPPVMDSST